MKMSSCFCVLMLASCLLLLNISSGIRHCEASRASDEAIRQRFCEQYLRRNHQPHRHHQHQIWCKQFTQRVGRKLPPPPPPPFDDEIDPRYGVEKRLVPTGPNPLHNWSVYSPGVIVFLLLSYFESLAFWQSSLVFSFHVSMMEGFVVCLQW